MSSERDEGSDTEVPSGGESVVALASTTTGKYQKQYYEDPAQIDVTSVTARVRWTWTGTCTTWSKHSFGSGWYTPSGWSRLSYTSGTDRSCTYGATSSNAATYRNTIFCDGIPGSNSFDTHNDFYTNYVQGRSNGVTYYQWDARKWGGCTNLLSWHRATGNWSG